MTKMTVATIWSMVLLSLRRPVLVLYPLAPGPIGRSRA